MFSSWSSKKDLKQEADTRDYDGLVQQLIDKLRADGGDKAGEQLVAGGEIAHPSELYDRAHLRRWLVAREWDVAAAHRSLVEHASWRAYQVPGGRVRETRIPGPLSDGKVFLQGVDRQGRAVLIVQARHHRPIPAAAASGAPPPLPSDPDAPLDPLRQQRAFVTYVLDALVALCDPALNPGRRLVSVFDLTGAGYANLDVAAMKHVIGTLNAHSVERMQTLYFYNPPTVFFGLWRALSPLLPEATRHKIKLVDVKQRSELLEAIGADVLPKEYGGEAELIPVQEAVRRFSLPPASGTVGEHVAAAAARLAGAGAKGEAARRSVDLAVEAAAHGEGEAVAVMA